MPMLKKFSAALEEIIDGIITVLEAARDKEKPELPTNLTIIRGDRARPNPDPPAIWVFADYNDTDHKRRTHAEENSLSVRLIAIVKDSEAEDGSKAANKLAADARSVVTADRTLNLDYVQDVKYGRFTCSGPAMKKDTLFASEAVVIVEFIILERNP